MTTFQFNASDFLFLDSALKQEIIVKKATIKDFFRFVKNNPEKNFELLNGRIIAMSSASPEHNRIINNIGYHLTHFFRSNKTPCLFYSETNCKIDEYTCVQPDIIVICNQTKTNRNLKDPIIVGEVHSTNRKDDREKLIKYQNSQSIKEILMIEQKKVEITLYSKDANGNWNSSIYRSGDVINFTSIDFSVAIEDIYEEVTFNKK